MIKLHNAGWWLLTNKAPDCLNNLFAISKQQMEIVHLGGMQIMQENAYSSSTNPGLSMISSFCGWLLNLF